MTIAATILTGFRPELLRKTLESSEAELRRCDRVFILHNGGDAATTAVLDTCGIPHERGVRDGAMIPNGDATSICAGQVMGFGCALWWHLEDDWIQVPELVERSPTWFVDAQELASQPEVGQVRLREESHLGQMIKLPDGLHGDGSKAANHNWIDGRPVAWRKAEASFMLGAAHWIQNPFICRAELAWPRAVERAGTRIGSVYPAETERHAMARFYGLNLLVAQLCPGVFRHIGDGHSLEGHQW